MRSRSGDCSAEEAVLTAPLYTSACDVPKILDHAERTAMRLGIFMMPVHPLERSFTETLAEDEEKALYADRLGFDEMWLGEHFSAASEPIPSPLMFMASLVPRTSHLKFGTAVICLPSHDPVKVAAEVAQFDHMSRGRFMLGIGPGGLLSDFELFGNADRGVRA